LPRDERDRLVASQSDVKGARRWRRFESPWVSWRLTALEFCTGQTVEDTLATRFGTVRPPGSNDRWSLEFLLADVVFGHDIQKTIGAPMFNTSHFP
jgi:hypothetical protein